MVEAQQPNLQRFLDRLTSRSILSEREQREIRDLPACAVHRRANEDFVRLGELVDHATFVVEGLVGRFDQNANGGRQITALHIAGDVPDLFSVVQPTATSALQALSSATVLRIPHEAIRSIAARWPAIAEALWRDCMVDSMILAQWVVNVGRRDARSRISHLLCEMACRYKADQTRELVMFDLPMTQAHLADATGLTPVHVNRVLRALREHGVEVRHRTVYISDWPTLVEIGDFDPGYLQIGVRPERIAMRSAI